MFPTPSATTSSYVSAHYAQAYMQQHQQQPGPRYQQQPQAKLGDCRCTYKNCTFTGSQKNLQIHRMDRHLIYPDGWENKKNTDNWDTDPSLKGKPVPIQGTGIILDTPEALDAWIAERKRRWPTAARAEDKKRKREQALARGQISIDNPDLLGHGSKRQRTYHSRDRSKRGMGRGRGLDGRARGRARGGLISAQPRTQIVPLPVPASSSDSDTDDDSAPEVISSRAPTNIVEHVSESTSEDSTPESPRNPPQTIAKIIKKPPPQPKKPPHNPFATRPTLLHNLLLPEIRITVSNFSQAIRFLVDNDFLRGVELTAGEAASHKIIEVVETKENIPNM